MAARLKVTRAQDVKPEKASFLQGTLRLGAANLLAGDMGLGKSTEAARWAREFTCTGDRVLVVVGEDAMSDTLRPRYQAAGCDLDLVEFLEVEEEDGTVRPLSFPADTGLVVEAIDAHGAGLVVVDPVAGHLDARYNAHNDQQVRQALGPLVVGCRDRKVTLLMLAHIKKGAEFSSLDRIGGAKGLPALCRSVMFMVADDDRGGRGGDHRLVAHLKSNGSALAPTRRIRIEEQTLPGGIVTTRTVVEGDDERNGFEVTASPDAGRTSSRTSKEPTARRQAGEWLCERLEEGAASWRDELVPAGTERGHSEATLRAARDELKDEGLIRKQRQPDGRYVWELAATDDTDKDSNHSNFNNHSKQHTAEVAEVEQVAELAEVVPLPLTDGRGDESPPACRRHVREQDEDGWRCCLCGIPMEAA